MLNLLLCALALSAPQDNWTALRLPELCEESNPSAQFPALDCGGHIQLAEATNENPRGLRAPLSAMEVGSLLERGAGAAGRKLTLFPYAPPLLARGSAPDLRWAKETLKVIDAAGKHNRLTISAWLVPQNAAQVPGAGDEWPNARSWQTTVQPGAEVVFGQRQHTDFIATYDVNVATDSGVAAPRVGGFFTGKTVHLSASRVDGGASYHLRGLLDMAELATLTEFDPDTPDLGTILQPILNTVTVAFSGVARSGEFLRVELEGTPLLESHWTLFVRVNGTLAGSGMSAEVEPWRAIDVSLLSKRARSLPSFGPGAGLHGQGVLEAMTPQAALISASGVLSAVEQNQPGGRANLSSSGNRPPVQICEGLLLMPAGSDGGLAQQVASFVRSVEKPRLASCQVQLKSGTFRASFPMASGEVGRLSVGQERTFLTGYRVEIAPHSWMPAPMVEHSFDGLAWQGRSSADQLTMSSWISKTESVLVRDRYQTHLGALQLPKRSVRGARKTGMIGQDTLSVMADLEGSPGLRMELQPL
ncbi:MAG: hypothetical protein ACI8X5_001775 [Planctomycetota bacterium]|jgi:hypothetical protein